MAKYEKYAEYKDSGVEWLGEIPRHWDSKPLKYLCTYNNEVLPETTAKDAEIQYIDIGSVSAVDGISKIETMIFKDAPSRARRIVRDGDVIVSTVRTYLEAIAPINNPPENLIVSTGFAVIRPNQYLYKSFASYCLRAKGFIKEVVARSVGVSYPAINSSDLVNITIPSIEYAEQVKIANFLDHETAKIDHLIEKQQQLIELLKEKRQAVISHAVTKGLNPNVKMKDSGVEWLGEVPEHWDVIAISKVTQKITNGYVGPTRDILVEEGIPYVQATHIKKGKVNFDNAYFVREKWSNDHAKSILKKDDVLIVQTGAGTGDVGLVSESEEGFNCHALIILQPKKQQLSGSYLAYCLQSDYGYATLYSIRTGGMHPHLNCGEVQFVKISVPPLDEQVAISKFIEKNIQDFDQLIEKAKLAIQLMQERRTALISAAVTGKIDVRHWQAPTVAEAHTELSA
ncbi:MAG: restriction endonuclease subunit S [Acinetobacter junii]|nr:restriction endonuclease subunit S [Acinetobacter junii]